MKKRLLKYGITAAVGAVIAYAVMESQGLFEVFGKSTQATYHILCDAFFVPGILILMFGILMWIATTGLFDSLGYAARTALHLILPVGLKERKTFYDYKLEKEEKREGKGTSYFLLIVGGIYIAISLVFLALYMTVA